MGSAPLAQDLLNLTHYLRSRDLSVALLKDAAKLDEFAFALGALAHYAPTRRWAIKPSNRITPLIYPRFARIWRRGHV